MTPLSPFSLLLSLLLLLPLSLPPLLPLLSACTTIAVNRLAMKDHHNIVTHNNDCTDCDIRLNVIPSHPIPPPSTPIPIFPCKFQFPRMVFPDNSHGKSYEIKHLQEEIFEGSEDYLSSPPLSSPLGYVKIKNSPPPPSDGQSFSYIEGTYPIANSVGLSMGESTCASRLVSYGRPWGSALFDISNLQRIAMERCATARCAIQLMGDLSTEYGYYGANDPPEFGDGLYEESGEALTIADPNEVWVFHIMPDPSGKSSIWVAQKVPDGHFTVIANKFNIRHVHLEDSENFMGTKNMREIAVGLGFWPANRTDFDFSLAFAPDAAMPIGWADRRTWRLFDWVAPSMKFSPEGTQHFPFSVRVESPLHLRDVFSMNRDHFEGTPYDLSIGPAGGPYGNPNRYDRTRRPEYAGGYFERAISLHRTSYSFTVQSRQMKIPSLQGILWFAQHAPHSSLFVPFYSSSAELSPTYTLGNIFQLSRQSSWWAAAATENFAEKMFSVIHHHDIYGEQKKFELSSMEEIITFDKEITLKAMGKSKEISDSVPSLITQWTIRKGDTSTTYWWNHFDRMIAKFRDGLYLPTPSPPLRGFGQFYPAWWLGSVGYYNNGPMKPYMIEMPLPQPPPNGENATLGEVSPMNLMEKHAALKWNLWGDEEVRRLEGVEEERRKGVEKTLIERGFNTQISPSAPSPPLSSSSSVSLSPLSLCLLITVSMAMGVMGTLWTQRKFNNGQSDDNRMEWKYESIQSI